MNNLASKKKFNSKWLKYLPNDWQQKKIKRIFKIKKEISGELGYDVISITQNGARIKNVENGAGQLSMDYSKYQLVNKGDFLMNHMDLLTGYVDVSVFNGVTSPDYRVFSLIDKNCDSRFLLYLLQYFYKNKIFYAYGRGSSHLGRWRLPTVEFENFYLPIPSQNEQKTIANYLDKKITLIDLKIKKINESIRILKEKRKSLIHNFVTKGINIKSKMKDTEDEWIGEVPIHWKKTPIKYIFNYFKGSRAQTLTKEYIEENPGPYPVYSGSTTPGGIGSINEFEFNFKSAIHVSTVGYLSAQILEGKFSLSQNCMILTPKISMNINLIKWIIEINFSEIEKQMPKIIQMSFRFEDLEALSIFIPPTIEEQDEIYIFLKNKIQYIDKRIELEFQRINFLNEYRQSLISQMVTGIKRYN